MKDIKYFPVILLLFCIGITSVSAQSIILSNGLGGGAWESSSTWIGGVIPGVLDSAVILSTDSVSTHAIDSCRGININSGGRLAMYANFVPNNVLLDGKMFAYADTIFEQDTMIVGSGAVYNHARDGGRLPIANWLPGSTLLMTGITGVVPTNRSQNFYNFTWNCPNQASNLSMSWDSITIGGDINILRTGTTARWYLTTVLSGDSAVLTVMGNINVVRGAVSSNGTGNGNSRIVIFVHGNINVNGEDPSRDSCNFSVSRGSQGGTGTAIWYLFGNMTVNNAICQNSNTTNNAKFVFVKPGTQTLTLGATDSIASFPIQIASGTTLDVGGSIVRGNGLVIIDSGATLLCGNIGGINGTFAGNGTKTFSPNSNYFFNGSTAQNTGTLMPDTVANLTTNNLAGVTLSDSILVTGTLAVTSGNFNLGNKLVTLSSSALIYEAGGYTARGTITTTRDVAQSSNETFGGLGLTINASDAAPGLTTVHRITGTAQSGGGNNSILRAFDIAPTVNTGLNASLIFHYDNSELNGQNASTLLFWESNDDGTTWDSITCALDTSLQRLQVSGLGSLYRYTASDASHFLGGTARTYSFDEKWNMISLPLVPMDNHKTAVFPTATSSAFAYSGSYLSRDTLTPGVGYWLKFASAQNINIGGTPFSTDTIDLVEGWNMTGAISDTVAVGSVIEIPSGTVVSDFFGYQNGYSTSLNLAPSKAYWVKGKAGGGKIVLTSGSFAKGNVSSRSEMISGFNSITITDRNKNTQTLYIGSSVDKNFNLSSYELPPSPPSGVFDVRFASGRYVETYSIGDVKAQEFPVQLKDAAFPVTVQWHVAAGNIALSSGIHSAFKSLSGDGKMTLTKETGSLVLRTSSSTVHPETYSLGESFPNPFNPLTKFQITMPEAAQVFVGVYNILGQQVATLVNEQREAGTYQIEWNGTSDDRITVETGVYFIRMISGNFSDVKKVMLMK